MPSRRATGRSSSDGSKATRWARSPSNCSAPSARSSGSSRSSGGGSTPRSTGATEMIELSEEFKGTGVDPFVDAYELAQAREGPVDLAAFLPDPGHPLYPAVLCELVRIDLEYHWTRGRPVPLEDYLSRFPALVHAPDLLRQA